MHLSGVKPQVIRVGSKQLFTSPALSPDPKEHYFLNLNISNFVGQIINSLLKETGPVHCGMFCSTSGP